MQTRLNFLICSKSYTNMTNFPLSDQFRHAVVFCLLSPVSSADVQIAGAGRSALFRVDSFNFFSR